MLRQALHAAGLVRRRRPPRAVRINSIIQGWSLRLLWAADGPPGPPARDPGPPLNDGPPSPPLRQLQGVMNIPGASPPGERRVPTPAPPALPDIDPDDVVRLLELPRPESTAEDSESGGRPPSSDSFNDLLGEFARWRDGGSHTPEVGDRGPFSPPGGPQEQLSPGSIDWDAFSLPSAFGTPPPADPETLPSSSSSSSDSTPSFFRVSPARMLSPEPAAAPAPAAATATMTVVGRIPVITIDDPATTPPRAPSQARPGLGPDWLGILNNLTQRQLNALNEQATALVMDPSNPELEINLPPREVSDPADDNEENDDPQSDQDDDGTSDTPDEEEEVDSNLGFLARTSPPQLTDEHHPHFSPPSQITAPVTDHRVQSILSSGAKT